MVASMSTEDITTKVSKRLREEFDAAPWRERYRTWTSFVDAAVRELIDRENRLRVAGVSEE